MATCLLARLSAPAGVISETTAALANSNTDSDDNGTLQTAGVLNGAVISSTVTLGPSGDTEPTTEIDQLEGVVWAIRQST